MGLGGEREPTAIHRECGQKKTYMQKNFAGGQEEPGSIMRAKLVTGSCPEQKSGNCSCIAIQQKYTSTVLPNTYIVYDKC